MDAKGAISALGPDPVIVAHDLSAMTDENFDSRNSSTKLQVSARLWGRDRGRRPVRTALRHEGRRPTYTATCSGRCPYVISK